MPVSILLLTLNEEQDLPRCLDAISWCDDIVVMDSFSSDATVRIAEQAGARLFQRKFDNFAGQRNYALEHVEFRHPWIFHLDADEVMTPELVAEISSVLDRRESEAYRVPSKMMFFGKWLRFSGLYPSYQVRLTRHPGFRFKQVGHGQRENLDPSRIGTLNEPYLHYSFSKGLTAWMEKHNRYSSQEALENMRQLQESAFSWSALWSPDRTERRRALKELSCRLPLRPLIRFAYMYLFRRGFLDGSAGFTYCCLLSWYEFMIVLKLRELRESSER